MWLEYFERVQLSFSLVSVSQTELLFTLVAMQSLFLQFSIRNQNRNMAGFIVKFASYNLFLAQATLVFPCNSSLQMYIIFAIVNVTRVYITLLLLLLLQVEGIRIMYRNFL